MMAPIRARLRICPDGSIKIHWSSDSRFLRFTVHALSAPMDTLWELDSEGKARQLASPEGADEPHPLSGVWIGNGDFLFASVRPGGTDLWRMKSGLWPWEKSAFRQLTGGPLDFYGPATIPGRTDLAVIGARKRGELVRFDSKVGRFVPFLNGISAEMANFSRDGKWAVYVTYPERDLWRSRIDGTEPLQLTHAPLRAGLPQISPDGRQIVFTGDYSRHQLRTWIVPFDGGEPRPVTDIRDGTAEVGPKWSPDSRRLLFRFDPAVYGNHLRILDLSSGKVEIVPGSENRFNQRWSPDGRWILATPNNEKGLDLFDVEQRTWTNLTSMTADYPEWSRNGKYVYFCTRAGNDDAIYRIALDSRKPELVATLVGTPRAYDELYTQWVGLAPDDSPILLRSADLQQIYLLSVGAR